MSSPVPPTAGPEQEYVLEVEDLRTYFFTSAGVVKAVDGLTYHVKRGECVALVGESACGKSASAMSVLRLIPYPPGVIVSGKIRFKGEDLLSASEERMRQIRGNHIGIVFQEPMTSLNPVLSIGRQLTETLEMHKGMSRDAARAESIRLLELVGIPDASKRIRDIRTIQRWHAAKHHDRHGPELRSRTADRRRTHHLP